MSDSYINLIFSSRSRERGLLHPDHGLPRRCTTAECGPLMTKINAHIHTYIHIYAFAFMYMQSYACMPAYIHMHNIFICMNTYFHMHAYILSYACIHTFLHGHMHAYIHTYICIQASSHVCSMHAHMCTCIHAFFEIFHCIRKGVSADADPHYQKLYGRVTDVCSNRKSQPKSMCNEMASSWEIPLIDQICSPVR